MVESRQRHYRAVLARPPGDLFGLILGLGACLEIAGTNPVNLFEIDQLAVDTNPGYLVLEFGGKFDRVRPVVERSELEREARRERRRITKTEILRRHEESVLPITGIRGSAASSKTVESFKKSSAYSKKFVRKNAVIGVTGLR